jgi:hypothetical protein
MHKVLILEEVQKNTVSTAESDVAVKIKGDFCWQLGEKEKDEVDKLEEYNLRRGGRGGRGVRGGRGGRGGFGGG